MVALRFVLALCVLAFAGIGTAYAGCTYNAGRHTCTTQEEAWAAAASGPWPGNEWVQNACPPPWPTTATMTTPVRTPSGARQYDGRIMCAGGALKSSLSYAIWTVDAQCPNGFDDTLGECRPDDTECLERNNDPGFSQSEPVSRNFTSRCISGCTFQLKNNGPTVCTDGICTGNYAWTGACPVTNPPPPGQPEDVTKDDPQECVTYATGQKFCQKTNNEQCYTSSNGKQTCWTPGETGEKNSDNVKQKRDPGPTEIPPNLTLPNGDTLTQQGVPKTQTTTITNPGTPPRTVTTTTTNYITTNGTNSGPTQDGEADDGSDTGEDDEGKPGKVTGGGNCSPENKPVVEGDPLLASIVLQTWATRCAVESGNAVTSTGEIGDCSSDFTISGPPGDANVLKLKAARAQICGEESGPIQDVDFLGDGTGEAPASSVMHEFEAGEGGWDMSGFGFSRSCPQFPTVTIYGHTYDLGGDGRNAAACSVLTILGWFVLFGAGLWCLKVVTEA